MSELKHKPFNAIIWNLLEKFGIQIFTLIIGVILARILTPSDFGLIGMISVFFALSTVFINSGFGAAYIQKKNADEVDASTIFFFNLFVSIFLYTILWFAAPLVANFYNVNELVDLMRVSATVLVINALALMQTVKLTKEINFKRKTIISLISIVISGTIAIVLALNDFGVWSLVFQNIIRTIVNCSGLWIAYSWRPLIIFKIESLKSMFSFSGWILLQGLLRTFFDNIYILIIGKFFPVAQLGFYSKAKSYQKTVSKVPASAIGTVSFPIFSNLQNDPYKLKKSMKNFIQHSIFFIAPISGILIVIAKPLINLLLTDKWVPMTVYFQLLLIAGILFPISLMNVQLLNAQGKSNLNFKLSIFKNSLRIISILITFRFGLVFIIYGEIIVSVISLFINGYYTKIFIKYGMMEQLRDLSKTLFIVISIVFIGLFSLNYIKGDFMKLSLGLILTSSLYLVLQFIFNREFSLSCFNMIRSRIQKRVI